MDQRIRPDPMHAEYVKSLPTDFSSFPENFSDLDLGILKNTEYLKSIILK